MSTHHRIAIPEASARMIKTEFRNSAPLELPLTASGAPGNRRMIPLPPIVSVKLQHVCCADVGTAPRCALLLLFQQDFG